jgi:hypothetical protein
MLTPPGILTPPPLGVPEPLLPPLISIDEQPVTKNAAATATIIGLANCAFAEIDGGRFMVFASGGQQGIEINEFRQDCLRLRPKWPLCSVTIICNVHLYSHDNTRQQGDQLINP